MPSPLQEPCHPHSRLRHLLCHPTSKCACYYSFTMLSVNTDSHSSLITQRASLSPPPAPTPCYYTTRTVADIHACGCPGVCSLLPVHKSPMYLLPQHQQILSQQTMSARLVRQLADPYTACKPSRRQAQLMQHQMEWKNHKRPRQQRQLQRGQMQPCRCVRP